MCSHLSYMSFVWHDAFCFCVPKMSSTPGDIDSGNSKRPVKRGKGQGTLCHAHCCVCMVWGLANFVDTNQRYSMSHNSHLMAFMAHENGDEGGSLDSVLV